MKIDPLNRDSVTEVIIHCSDTTVSNSIDASLIELWHRDRGFDCIGYHYVIKCDGTIELGRNLSLVGAHCLGHNHKSVGICYVGGRLDDGRPFDTRTFVQKISMDYLISCVILPYFPKITEIHGHNEFSTKVCPCFDVSVEYKDFISNLSNPLKII